MESKYIIHPLYPVNEKDYISYFKKNGKKIVHYKNGHDDTVSRFICENLNLLCNIVKNYLHIYSFEFVDDDAETYFFTELKKGKKFPGTKIIDGVYVIGEKTISVSKGTIELSKTELSKKIDALIDDATRNNFWLKNDNGTHFIIVFENEESRAQFVSELV